MRLSRLCMICCVAAATALSCGGGKKGGKGASAGSSKADQANAAFGTNDGKPGWIMRGNVQMTLDDGRKVFYAVGAASGIKNMSLLRSTADNRGRNELAKLFEVFTASLMKDYMSSSTKGGEEQVVEQAIKTAVSSSLKGSEIVDRYADGDGTLYALASLDLKVLKDVLAAEKAGAVKSFVTKVDVDDIFEAHGKKPPPPPAPPRVAAADMGSAPADNDHKGTPSANVRERTGEKPAWIDGEDKNFPYSIYLCGVGFGGDRTAAENGSYAALARIFIANVASMSKDFMGAYSKTGAPPVEVQTSETLTRVSTGKVFSGVQLMEVWGSGTVYALSCMERAKAASILREQIAALDEQAGNYIQKAASADKVFKVNFLGKALDAVLGREAYNTELRIVDVNGIGVSGPYAFADVAAAFETAVEELKVGVEINGPFEDEFRAAFIKLLTQRGFKVTDMENADPMDQDVLLAVVIKVEDGGKGMGSTKHLHFADASVVVEVKAVAANKVVGAVSKDKHRGHRNLEEAKRGAVRALAQEIIKKVGAKIDEAMTGRK